MKDFTTEETAGEESVLPEKWRKLFREANDVATIKKLAGEFVRFLESWPMPERGVEVAADGAVEISGKEFADFDDSRKLRPMAKAFVERFFNGRSYVNRATGMRIYISSTGIDKNFRYSGMLAKVQSMIALPELLQEAAPENSDFEAAIMKPDYKGRKGGVLGAYRFKVKIRIKGRPYLVTLTVRQHEDEDQYGEEKKRFYFHRLDEVASLSKRGGPVEETVSDPAELAVVGGRDKAASLSKADGVAETTAGPASLAAIDESIANRNSPVKEKAEVAENMVLIEEKITEAQQKRLDSIVNALDKAKGSKGLIDAAGRFANLWLNKASQGKTKIADFGEKIGGARKDQWKDNVMTLDDLDLLNDLEKVEHVKKDNIWTKPNYKKMVEDGVDPAVAYVIKKVRDKLPVKPVVPKSAADQEAALFFRRYVTLVERTRDALSNVRAKEDVDRLSSDGFLDGGELRRVVFPPEGILNWRFEGTQLKPHRKDHQAWKNFSKRLFLFGKYDLEDARRTVEETGWPENKPWLKGLRIMDGTRFGGHYKNDEFLVGKKAGEYSFNVLQSGFKTREEAETWLKEKYEESQKEGGAKKKDGAKTVNPVRPQLKHIEREGPDYRQGKDATGEDFTKTFRFRGGEFGNWTSQEDRRQSMNHAFDAMRDLADVLGLPPEVLGLNGRLSIAFGARGGGRFAAHYEPARRVINLTKTKGAGSLSHEFAHGFDHLLGDMDGSDRFKPLASARRSFSGMRPELGQAFQRLKRTMLYRTLSREEFMAEKIREMESANARILELAETTRDAWLIAAKHAGQDKNSPESFKKFKDKLDKTLELVRKLVEPAVNKFPLSDVQEARDISGGHIKVVREIEKLMTLGSEAQKELWELVLLKRGIMTELTQSKLQDSHTLRSSFYTEALSIDGKRKKPYWSDPVELLARAFEGYIQDKLEGKMQKSDYLVHSTKKNGAWGKHIKPFPEGKEREAVNRAFDDFFAELKVKDDDSSILEGVVEQAEANRTEADLIEEKAGGADSFSAVEMLDKAQGLDDLLKAAERFAADLKNEKLREELKRELVEKPILKGLAISTELLDKGTASIVGRQVKDYKELAGMAQIYRDPRYETLRYIWVKDEKIVGHTAVSSRLPGMSKAFPNGVGSDDGLLWMKEQLSKHKADGFYLIHNHPSGTTQPSRADLSLTGNIARHFSEFKGHAI